MPESSRRHRDVRRSASEEPVERRDGGQRCSDVLRVAVHSWVQVDPHTPDRQDLWHPGDRR